MKGSALTDFMVSVQEIQGSVFMQYAPAPRAPAAQ